MDILSAFANTATIATAIVAVGTAVYFWRQRRTRRDRLEKYLSIGNEDFGIGQAKRKTVRLEQTANYREMSRQAAISQRKAEQGSRPLRWWKRPLGFGTGSRPGYAAYVLVMGASAVLTVVVLKTIPAFVDWVSSPHDSANNVPASDRSPDYFRLCTDQYGQSAQRDACVYRNYGRDIELRSRNKF